MKINYYISLGQMSALWNKYSPRFAAKTVHAGFMLYKLWSENQEKTLFL